MSIAERQKPPPGDLFLDHVGHFVPDLAAAGKLAESLGFVVTPESPHRAQGSPAGTSNRCIMLEQGYIEILAPTLDTPNAKRVRDFMARYNGVHLACFGTPDAQAEHRRLAAHGFDPEAVVSLERSTDDGVVRFRVVYVPPHRMPEGRIQYVQQLTPETIWQPRHLAHRNGAVGLSAVYVVAKDPVDTAARWAEFAGLLPSPDGAVVTLTMARGQVVIGSRDALEKILGHVPPAPGIAGYGLACRDPERFLAGCRKTGLTVKGSSIVLPPALGGAWHVTESSLPLGVHVPGER
jgi:hypothetical protein